MIRWLKNTGEDRDVIVSSRIRLARNLDDYFFPIKISQNDATILNNEVVSVIQSEKYEYFRIKDMPSLESKMLIEKHIISPALVQKSDISGFVMSKDETETIMINEEDHIRIQVIDSGLSLSNAWIKANEIDNILEKKLNYAFDEKIGYLTSCPTNIGTGLRASVMLHMPALEITKQISKVLSTISQFGLAVRGVYGEGTKAMGSLYQISNQTTLGDSEETIIKKIENISKQIAEKERSTRKILLDKNSIDFEDKIFRAYGILKNSRTISTDEAVRLLSYIKLGICTELIKNNDINEIDKLFIEIQPASIQFLSRLEMNENERDIYRAKIIRELIN